MIEEHEVSVADMVVAATKAKKLHKKERARPAEDPRATAKLAAKLEKKIDNLNAALEESKEDMAKRTKEHDAATKKAAESARLPCPR